jgi:hypothetical protein
MTVILKPVIKLLVLCARTLILFYQVITIFIQKGVHKTGGILSGYLIRGIKQLFSKIKVINKVEDVAR